MGANRTRQWARAVEGRVDSTGGKLAIRIAFAAALALAWVPEGSAETVAEIDGAPVSSDDYINYFKAYARSKLYHGGSRERLRELADEALENMITDRLLQREARRRSIAGDDAAVAKRIADIEKQYAKTPEWAAIEKQLPVIEDEIRADTQIEALKTEVSRVAPPTESTLRKFHADNIALFTQPPAFDLDLILFGLPPSAMAGEWREAAAAAEAVVAELRAGGSFAEAAAQHSTHDTKSLGGKLGQIHRGQIPEEAQAAVERLSPGQITDPVRTLQGIAILRLNGMVPETKQPFDSVRERVEAVYMRETAESQWTTFLKDLRASAKIETSDVAALVEETLAKE